MITTSHRLTTSPVLHRGSELRLDLLVNPYAPTPSARTLAVGFEESGFSAGLQLEMLLTRLSGLHQVPVESIVLVPGVDDLFGATPEPEFGEWIEGLDRSITVASPDHVTGRFLTVQDAVRIARTHDTVIVDERLSGYFHRDHIPLFREFEHVVLLRSLDPWLLPLGRELSYIIAKPAMRDRFAGWRYDADPMTMGLALATLEDDRYMVAANRRVTRERVGLLRSLRKLNMLRPHASAANFVSATIERGDRESLRCHLERERIGLRYPDSAEHPRKVRISALSSRATATLTAALIDWARDI